jgi:hypothetical protein
MEVTGMQIKYFFECLNALENAFSITKFTVTDQLPAK